MILEEQYVNFICEHKLTQGQFLLLFLMYKERLDLIQKYKQTFPADDGTMIGRYWLDDLITRGFVAKEDNRTKVTVLFKQQFCNKIDVAEELLKAYPSTLEIDGKIIPLTAIDTIEVANLYIDKILDNREEHEEVLKDIQYAVQNNMINIGIKKFILSKYWLAIRKKRKTTDTTDIISKQSRSFG
jgi:hypothetical protein